VVLPRAGLDPRPPLPPPRGDSAVRCAGAGAPHGPHAGPAAFGEALRRTLAALRRGDDAERWQRLFAVARCLLAVPARCEGAPADVVARRCRVWSAGWFGAAGMMFAYTVAKYAREVVGPGVGERLEAEPPRLAFRPQVTPHDPLSCPVPPRRAAASTALALRGWYARAVAALSASGVAAPSEATLAALKALQASAPPVERGRSTGLRSAVPFTASASGRRGVSRASRPGTCWTRCLSQPLSWQGLWRMRCPCSAQRRRRCAPGCLARPSCRSSNRARRGSRRRYAR
jgi:hypothetical protein